MKPIIIFDFDGTVSVGDGPAWFYAECVNRHLNDENYLTLVETEFQKLSEGSSAYKDGYDAAGALGAQAGLDAQTLEEAYQESRRELGQAAASVELAPGLRELFEQLPTSTETILATNAPETSIHPLLDHWGISEQFSQLHFSVGKPSGLTPIVEEAQQRGAVLSVGDIYENDLAPAAELNAATALITPAQPEHDVTFYGASMKDLVPSILAWAEKHTPSPIN